MERIEGNMCPLDGRVENHEHVLRHYHFSSVLFDIVRKAFGLVGTDSKLIAPSRLLWALAADTR